MGKKGTVPEAGSFGIGQHAETPRVVENQRCLVGFNHDMVMLFLLFRGKVADFDFAAHAQMPDDGQPVVEFQQQIFCLAADCRNLRAFDSPCKIVRDYFPKTVVVNAYFGYIGFVDRFEQRVFYGFDFR